MNCEHDSLHWCQNCTSRWLNPPPPLDLKDLIEIAEQGFKAFELANSGISLLRDAMKEAAEHLK